MTVVDSRERKREGARGMRYAKGEDQFRLLPDELLVLILNKVADAKWLCRCSIVSKRFSSVVFHTHTVSIEIPQSLKRISGSEEIPITEENAFSQFSYTFEGVFKFLYHFKEIHSLHIDFPKYLEVGQEGMFKWEANFGTKLKCFTLVLSPSVSKMMNRLEEEEEQHQQQQQQQEESESEMSIDLRNQRVQQAFDCVSDAFLRHFVLLFIVKYHKALHGAAITDLRNGVRLCVDNEQLSHLTNLVSQAKNMPPIECAERIPKCVKVGHVPVLRLPLCGYVMKGATVLVMKQVDQQKETDNGDAGYDHAVIGGGFEGEERAFNEAVSEMLKNHGDKMQTLTLP